MCVSNCDQEVFPRKMQKGIKMEKELDIEIKESVFHKESLSIK